MPAPMSLELDEVVATGLVKTYGATRALAGVSLTLRAASITAVVGHNGSGKSTLLGLLAGLVRPTRGTIRYGADDRLRRSLGVVGHAPMLYPDLSGRENLALASALHGCAQAAIDARIAELELGGFVDRPVRTYSRGQLQRTSLARALVPSPRLLLLDEPSTGLDAASTEALVGALARARSAGAIVLVVSHDGSLVERIADVRVRMERGRIVSGEAA